LQSFPERSFVSDNLHQCCLEHFVVLWKSSCGSPARSWKHYILWSVEIGGSVSGKKGTRGWRSQSSVLEDMRGWFKWFQGEYVLDTWEIGYGSSFLRLRGPRDQDCGPFLARLFVRLMLILHLSLLIALIKHWMSPSKDVLQWSIFSNNWPLFNKVGLSKNRISLQSLHLHLLLVHHHVFPVKMAAGIYHSHP
jgi:hypothetical protein